MKLLNLLFKRETAAPMLALTFASATSVALVVARVCWTRELRYGFLIWNLFLAWLPVVFALMASDEYRNPPDQRRRWHVFGWSAAWLLFFPNAPYIFTDLIHLTRPFLSNHYWVDLTLILICAVTGLVLGFVSLYQMQSIATRVFGRVTGWLFVAAAAGLSSVGVYLGRFLRFNSWDVFLRPARVYQRLDDWMDGRLGNQSTVAFLGLFATFLFLAYVMLYGLTHLSPEPANVSDERELKSA
jgi:uncharacterized membrane protein